MKIHGLPSAQTALHHSPASWFDTRLALPDPRSKISGSQATASSPDLALARPADSRRRLSWELSATGALPFHPELPAARSIGVMSLWLTEVVSPLSQSIVTPLQDVPLTVPWFFLPCQKTRSPTLSFRD
jgi:hypothetical protein